MTPRSDQAARAHAAVDAAAARGPVLADAFDRTLAIIRRFRAVRRVQVNRDRNAGADLGGEAGDYTVERFEDPVR